MTLASITTFESECLDDLRMSNALASAIELLASHCFGMVESGGADHDLVVSVVQSAITIRNLSDLMILATIAAIVNHCSGYHNPERKVSSIPTVLSWVDSISSDGFFPFILLLVVIIVTVIIVVVTVILIVVVVAIVVVVFVVAIIGVVVVIGGVSFIIKLSFVIIGFLHRIVL
nr:hypothetical protein [Tanacetum cinerariifolium]